MFPLQNLEKVLNEYLSHSIEIGIGIGTDIANLIISTAIWLMKPKLSRVMT